MKYFSQNLKNNIDFFLRQHLVLSRKNYSEKNESKEGVLSGKALVEKNYLAEKFDLSYIEANSTRQNYLENLYIIDILDSYLEMNFQENLNVLDIGCKNWFYAKGEYFFFKKYCKNLKLDGIELDSNRLYFNLYSRKEAAKFYTKGLDNVNYIEKNFLKHRERYDYIVWILPFVVEEPLIKWGLPMRFFQPEKMLQHAYNSLKNGGKMIIINQGEDEYNIQKKLCGKLNIKYTTFGEVKSEFLDYNIPRHAVLIKKEK
jgi:hypothetical protein